MRKYTRRFLGILLALAMTIGIIGPGGKERVSAATTDDFIRGVDVSSLDMLEKLGAKYYENGKQDDALSILNRNGANYVRLKLWVDPYDENGNPYGGGTNDFNTTLSLAKRAKAKGMKVLIDFHLSDFWADPANQIKPKAWNGLSYEQLKNTLYNYMKNTLNDFARQGVIPEMVQVGNEISSGILHDDGKVGGSNNDFTKLGELLHSAIRGVRDSQASGTKVILHLDQGGKFSLYNWWFEELRKVQPNLGYDVIGLSYYPMWHGTMEGLQYNLNYLSQKYNKEVCVVETAYAWTTQDGDGVGNVFIAGDEKVGGYPPTVQGQIQFMNDLTNVILNVPNGKGLGFFYWEPEMVPVEGGTYATEAGVAYKHDTVEPSNTWDNMTLFDFGGNALASMKVLNKPGENLISNSSFEKDWVTTTPSDWNVWLGNGSTDAVKTEYGNAFEGNYKLSFWKERAYSCSIYKTLYVPNGKYRLTCFAMTNGKQKKLQLYAKNFGGAEKNTQITTSDVNWNMFTVDEIEVTNGRIEIGVYTVANANDWCNIDNISLRRIN